MQQVFAKFGKDMADKVIQRTLNSLPRSEVKRCSLPETKSWQAIMRRVEEIASSKGELWVTESILVKALLETESHIDTVLEEVNLTRQECLRFWRN